MEWMTTNDGKFLYATNSNINNKSYKKKTATHYFYCVIEKVFELRI